MTIGQRQINELKGVFALANKYFSVLAARICGHCDLPAFEMSWPLIGDSRAARHAQKRSTIQTRHCGDGRHPRQAASS
jgi:hypothetical protein